MNKKLQYLSGAFPDNSVCKITFKIKKPAIDLNDFLDDDFFSLIKKICVGELIKNEIESIVDFSSNKSINNFIEKNSTHYFQAMDKTSDAICLEFSVELYYGNVRLFSDEIKDLIISGQIQTFFARINF